MAFKRAMWHSGLTYQQTCSHCRMVVRYTDYNLDFRPWYPDGFVYCPRCRGPMRHNELYALNPDGTPMYPQPYTQVPPSPTPAPTVRTGTPGPQVGTQYCPNCGKQYVVGQDRFCAGCGRKLE